MPMTKTVARNAHLKAELTARRRAMQQDVRGRIRDGRADKLGQVGDDLEHSDADTQGNLELALLGMRAQAVIRVDEALARLDAGKYGACVECAGRIAVRRLRALPFAVRCQACEARREQEQGDARQSAQRPGGISRFSEFIGS